MLWSVRYRLLCWLLRLLLRCGLDELDLENAVLRHQLKVLRRGSRRILFTTADRAFLAGAALVLSRERWRSFLVGPDTLRRWHRDLVGRRRGRGSRRLGRPPLDSSIKHLILRLGRENPRWGYLRIRGELLKLGIDVSGTTIATVPKEGGLGPAPGRIGPTWTQFLRLQARAVQSSALHPEEEDLQDLEPDRERQMRAPAKDDPTAQAPQEPTGEVPCRAPSNSLAVVGAQRLISARSGSAGSPTRARGGRRRSTPAGISFFKIRQGPGRTRTP